MLVHAELCSRFRQSDIRSTLPDTLSTIWYPV